MNIVSTLRKQFEEGAQALWFVGVAMAVFTVFVFSGYGVFATTGFALYAPAMHHESLVAHIDQWFAWLQILYIVFASFLITGTVSAVMALACYGIEIVIGTFRSRKAKA